MKFLDELQSLITETHELFPSPTGDDPKIDESSVAKYHLRALLAEFRGGKREFPEQLRYLQSQLIRHRTRHNPLFTAIQQGQTSLDELLLDETLRRKTWAKFPEKPTVTIAILTRSLENALFAAARIEDVVETLDAFLKFHRVGTEGPSPPEKQELAAAARLLREIVLRIRQQRTVSSAEFESIKKSGELLRRELGAIDTFVPKALREYVVDAGITAQDALGAARNEVAPKIPWTGVMERDLHRLTGKYVLADQLLLKEILRNLFENLRYAQSALDGIKAKEKMPRLSVEPEKGGDAHDPLDYWVFRLRSTKPKKFKPPRADTTLGRHANEIRRYYGGSLVLNVTTDPKGQDWVEAELKLISRDELYKRMVDPPAGAGKE